jgi:hypothetical protein
MKNPCEDCLIKTICGELCEQRSEYTHDVNAELNGQIILFKKGMITEEKYISTRDLYRKVNIINFKITNGIEVEDWLQSYKN